MKGFSRYFLVGVGLIILGLAFWYFSNIIAYILVSVVLSLLGKPLVEKLCKLNFKYFKVSKTLAAAITLIVLFFSISLFFKILLPLIGKEAHQLSTINVKNLIASLREPLNEINSYIGSFLAPDKSFSIEAYLETKFLELLQAIDFSNIAGKIFATIGDFIVAIFAISFITFFFLKDSTLFVKILNSFIPNKYDKNVKKAMGSIEKLLVRYFIGIIIEMILVMTIDTIGLSIIGIGFSHALIIGLFAGLMIIVPYVGPIIGIMFGLTIGIATNLEMDFYTHTLPILGYMLIIFTARQIIDTVIFQPLIFSNSVKAHPLEIFIVIIMAGSIGGLIGMILAIPTYTVLRVIAKEFFYNYRFVKNLTAKMEN